MLRDLLVMTSTLAIMVAGQWAGIGQDLLNTHRELWINNTYAMLCCLVMLAMGRWIARVTIEVAWNMLTPIDHPTRWEGYVIEWLAFGVGSFVILLNYLTTSIQDVVVASAYVLLACAPVLLVAYLINQIRSKDVEPVLEAARPTWSETIRPYVAALAATISGLSAHFLPFLALAIVIGRVDPTSDFTAELLESALRAAPLLVLAGIMLQPYIMPIGFHCLRIVRFRPSGRRWEAVVAYAIPVCGLCWSALVFAVLTGTSPALATFGAVVVAISAAMSALVYLQILFGRGPVFLNLDTFN